MAAWRVSKFLGGWLIAIDLGISLGASFYVDGDSHAVIIGEPGPMACPRLVLTLPHLSGSDMTVGTEPELSAFERVGGAPAVKAVVDRFYERVLADNDLSEYYTSMDAAGMTQLKRHQAAMISQVLGGPREYAGRDLADAHRTLDISAVHYRRVSHLLVG